MRADGINSSPIAGRLGDPKRADVLVIVQRLGKKTNTMFNFKQSDVRGFLLYSAFLFYSEIQFTG